MSETFQHRLERLEHEPLLPAPERELALPEHTAAERSRAEQDQAHSLQEARKAAAELAQAESSQRLQEAFKSAEKAPQVPTASYIDRSLQTLTRDRELLHLQKKLPPIQRSLSRVIHQPAVRAVSEAAGKTVSRPSGLLGGGLVALLGTSTYLYLAKHIGFTYNYGVFLVLFVGGFALGLALELAVHLAHARRNSL